MPAPPASASHRPWRAFLSAGFDAAPGLAAIGAIWALSGGGPEASVIETRQIGLLVALGLAGIGAWGGWRAAGPGAVLAVLALLSLPPGTRSMAATAVLAASLVASLAGSRRQDSQPPAWRSLWRGYGLALAVQVLLRPTYLLPWVWDRQHALELIAFPLAAALLVAWLRRDFGEGPALLAAGSVALVGPAFDWHSLLVLAAFALAAQLRPSREAWRRALALAALLAVCLVETRWGALVLAASLPVAFPTSLLGLAPAIVAAAIAALFRLRSLEEVLPLLALAFVCVPTWFFVQRAGFPVRLGALAIALAGLLAAPAPASVWAPAGNPLQALAPALALIALVSPAWEARDRFQRGWSAGLLALAALFAAFPWLRPAPLEALARAVDLTPAGLAALAVAAAALALLPTPRWLQAAWPMAVAVALLLHVEPWGIHRVTPSAAANWAVKLPAGSGEVAVLSQLANAAALPKGSLVARLRARGSNGERLVYPIRAGYETGEWAARRPQMRALEGGQAPAAYRSRFTDSGEIGQSYRASFDVRGLPPPVAIDIAREPTRPGAIVFEVFSVVGHP